MSNEKLVTAIQAGEDRMGELWDHVERLVKWKANHVMTALGLRGNPCGVEFDDLYQSGYLAMVAAVDTYKPESGAFSTWFMYYLQNAFAEATGYRSKRERNEPLNNAVSLDKTMDDEFDGTPFGEFVPDPKAAATMLSIEERLWQEQLRKALETALALLPEKYADVMRLRHYQDLTLAEVGELRGVGAERVRQMENKAIRQLRKPNIACHLRAFYDFDFYGGTGLGAFQHTGMSIQERYLMVEEERKEREERRRQAQENERHKERIQSEYDQILERARQEAQEKLARMSTEEKEQLLMLYGVTES